MMIFVSMFFIIIELVMIVECKPTGVAGVRNKGLLPLNRHFTPIGFIVTFGHGI